MGLAHLACTGCLAKQPQAWTQGTAQSERLGPSQGPSLKARDGPRGLLMLGNLWRGMGHHMVKLLQQSATLIAVPGVSGMVPEKDREAVTDC